MWEKLNNYRIGVICGGVSAEKDVSLRSGENIYQALLRLGLNAVKLEVKEDVVQQIQAAKIDLAYIALHGKFGEDGCIQGLLQMLDIPYTGSGVLASAIGMDKVATKRMLIANGLNTPAFEVICNLTLQADLQRVITNMSFPMMIKPASEGSSIGISILNNEAELKTAACELFNRYDKIFVEEFVKGKEVTTGVIMTGGIPEALPILELKPVNEFYDYDAKYTKGKTDFILPANLEPSIYAKVQAHAVKVYSTIGCEGAARIDSIVEDNGKEWVIEINTSPGMTETSDLPAQAKEAGIGFDSLVKKIIISVLE